MNYVQVREIAGRKDEKGFQTKLTMFGTPTAPIMDAEFSKKGTKFQQLTITDDNGEQQKVKVYPGNGPELDGSHINQRLSFDIGPNPWNNQMYYNGFWNNQVQVDQQPSQQPPYSTSAPPQNAQQASSGAAGNVKEDKPVDWDAKDLRQARMNGLNNATCLMVMLAEMNRVNNTSPDDIKKVAAEYVDYIYNGIKKGSSPSNYDEANREMDEAQLSPPLDQDVPY